MNRALTQNEVATIRPERRVRQPGGDFMVSPPFFDRPSRGVVRVSPLADRFEDRAGIGACRLTRLIRDDGARLARQPRCPWKAATRGRSRAAAMCEEALALDWDHGWPVYHYLEDLADIAGRIGQPETAAYLNGVANAQRARVGRPVEPVYRAEFERDAAVAGRGCLRRGLGSG